MRSPTRALLILSLGLALAFEAEPAAGAGPEVTAVAGADGGATGGMGGAPTILVWPGRTSTIVVEDDVGHPLEGEPDFVAAAPSYRRAIAADRAQQWVEAAGAYQQALLEATAAPGLAAPARLEAVTFKIDLERRRSRALAEDEAARQWSATRQRTGPPTDPPARLLPLERARLLRLKMMAVRAATGITPGPLRTATLSALARALVDAESGATTQDSTGNRLADRSAPPLAEIRLLSCATLGASGDRAAARQQLGLVAPADRGDPARALSLAACQVALGYRDDALASLAVTLNRFGPASRFVPGPARELQTANDWDPLRPDPRFARLFQ